jgi:RNA 3'-terminal phosphate cyclase
LLERGKPEKVRVLSFASQALAERRVAERQAESAATALRDSGILVETAAAYGETFSPGSVVTCIVECEGGARLAASALGERGKPAEAVGRDAARSLLGELATGAPVDEHAADQGVIWLALGGGRIRASRVSEHAKTNLWITEQFIGPAFKVEGAVIRCDRPYLFSSTPAY